MRFTEPILHVDMDAFFVEVERLRRPELRGRPVVVGGSGRRSVVAAASYEARRFGVRSAMPSLEARRRCPELVFVAPDHDAYGAASERVFDVLRSFTPVVQALSVDEAFLDVGGLRLHHDSPIDVAAAIRAELRRVVDLPASVGIAGTPFVAKLASRQAKPDGLYHVPVAETSRFLAPLPIGEMWGVGTATEASLTALGLETIGDLQRTPPRVLERAVGSATGRQLGRLAFGEDDRRVTPETDAKSVSVETTLETDLTTLDEVLTVLRSQAEEVTRRLRRGGLAARTVSVKLRTPDFVTVNRSESRAEPMETGREVFAIAAGLVERELRTPRRVRLVGIGLSQLSSADAPRQLAIGDDARQRAVSRTVDRIRDRFGPDVVRPGREATIGSDESSKSKLTVPDPDVY